MKRGWLIAWAVAALKQLVIEQQAKISRLKGFPAIKPSGMDTATEPAGRDLHQKRPGRGKVTPRVSIEDRTLKAAVPAESRFKVYVT